MTNGEKFKTVDERANGFEVFCSEHICETCPLNVTKPDCGDSRGQFAWLELEADGSEPLPCPFCGSSSVFIVYDKSAPLSHSVACYCGYSSERTPDKELTIAAHNRVARAVVEAGKKEEKE